MSRVNNRLTFLNSKTFCYHIFVHLQLLKIIFLLASEKSEQVTTMGNSIENRGYLFIYVWMTYVIFCTLTLVLFLP